VKQRKKRRTQPDAVRGDVSARPSIAELERQLDNEEEAEIEILPNGEVREKGKTTDAERGGRKPLTMRENLGGEYGVEPEAVRVGATHNRPTLAELEQILQPDFTAGDINHGLTPISARCDTCWRLQTKLDLNAEGHMAAMNTWREMATLARQGLHFGQDAAPYPSSEHEPPEPEEIAEYRAHKLRQILAFAEAAGAAPSSPLAREKPEPNDDCDAC
jgi:hypothetical protein